MMIIRRSILLICTLFSGYQVLAQGYGNEWIRYNQSYYKIPVAQEGIYRLEYQDLADTGIPVNAIEGRKFQIFHRGVEQAIFEQNTGATQIEPGDYLEFYGQRNDGTLDSLLYQPSSVQPHKYYNLYSDTTAYFLTWTLDTQNGKRMPPLFQEVNVSGIPAQTSHQEELINLYTSEYSQGMTTSTYVALSAFDIGEGWTGPRVNENTSRDFQISDLTFQQQSDGLPALEILLTGRTSRDHSIEIYAGTNVSTLRDLGNYNISTFNNLLINIPLLWTDISISGDLTVRLEVFDDGVSVPPNSQISPSYIKVTFPQQWDMNSLPQKTFHTVPDLTDTAYLEIQNTPTNARLYDISDPDNVKRIGYFGNPNEINAIIPETITSRTLLVTSQDPQFETPPLKRVTFRNINPAAHSYIIISHPALMKPAGSYQNAVRAYSNYRASPEGGSYDTLVVSILDLYNQYSYGETTPLSIYNFMRRMVDQGDPEYLFVIGKALNVGQAFYRNDPSSFTYPELVPTGGYPASDAIFTAELDGAGYEPRIPTGRLPASKPEDVISYLEKIRRKEEQPFDNLWQKRLLHLSGGTSAFEKVQFQNMVNGFKAIAENIYLGGSVNTITKNAPSSVEFINISDEINDGLLMVTFLGHSAPGITDIDIGDVSNPRLGYDNKDKYPLFLVNGCDGGDFFGDYENWGADWLLTPEKGAIGFIAHSSYGFVNALKYYSDKFYEAAFSDSLFITRNVGQIQNEAAKIYQENTNETDLHKSQIQQMMYFGDPAVRVFGTNIPDYQTDNDNIFAIAPEGQPITNLTGSFDLGIIVRDFGAAIPDSLTATVTRYFPDGSVYQYDTLTFPGVFYQDTLIFPVNNEFGNNAGMNRFEVTINPTGAITELDDTNNFGTLTLLIPLNGSINLLPYNYAILGNQQVDLIAQSGNLLTENRTYLFEVDTSATYDNPFRQEPVPGKEMAQLQVNLEDIDTATYYWRTRYSDPKEGEEDSWEESSFTAISGVESGWAQVAFPQFSNSILKGISADSVNRKWNFEENQLSLHVKTFGANHPEFDFEDVEVEIDGLRYIFTTRLCRDNTINGIAFDKFTAAPYAALFEEIFSPRTCGRQIQVINNYTDAEILGSGNYLVNYIDAVKEGDEVVLFTIGTVSFSSWPQEIWDKLSVIGLAQTDLAAVNDGDPVIILGKKGSPAGSASIVLADYSSIDPAGEQEISLDTQVTGKYSEGTITSTKIGPALSWGSLYTEIGPDPAGTDESLFEISGIESDGTEVSLFQDLLPGSSDLSSVDATIYPELKLTGTFRDETNLTVPQLRKWLVTYEPPPEGVLIYTGPEFPITVDEGEPFMAKFSFTNISNRNFTDSLEVQYSILNISTRNRVDSMILIKPVPANETNEYELPVETKDFRGTNDFSVRIVPRELEQNLLNNAISIENFLIVDPDEVNPVVDVTIDGEHIFDGDIVSPSPAINVQVRDTNPYIYPDTTTVTLFITRPCENCVKDERISYLDPAVSWEAASEKKPFTMTYNPQNLENGMYTIEVQAEDATGNEAGEEPYKISFEVVNESTITHFYPYPNPFSSSTRFVFTLTGSQIPDQIKIQIMTISGKVVREILQDELGPIRIGNNISEYAWDGRDEYGDQLANGVYLYKVTARINGQDLDLRETSGDAAFTKGVGKMYLLR